MTNWIPCDEDNPPPRNTQMLVWIPERRLNNGLRVTAYPLWVDEDWQNVGVAGEDFTHYILISLPEAEL